MRPSRNGSWPKPALNSLIERLQGVDLGALRVGVEPLVAQVGDHLLGDGFGIVEGHALMFCGQEAGAPERGIAAATAGNEHHERRQVLIL